MHAAMSVFSWPCVAMSIFHGVNTSTNTPREYIRYQAHVTPCKGDSTPKTIHANGTNMHPPYHTCMQSYFTHARSPDKNMHAALTLLKRNCQEHSAVMMRNPKQNPAQGQPGSRPWLPERTMCSHKHPSTHMEACHRLSGSEQLPVVAISSCKLSKSEPPSANLNSAADALSC